MGGIGSGRPKERERTLVEDCDSLDISFISKYGFTIYPVLVEIINTDSNEYLEINYNKYWFGKRSDLIEYFEIVKTFPNFGGNRLWLKCPDCGRRVRKIYSPPHKTHFRCRICYDLMYQSQESNVYDYWLRNTSKRFGLTPRKYEKAVFG